MKYYPAKLVAIIFFVVVLLSACSASNPGVINEPSENTDNPSVQLDVTTPDRKIMYSAEATLYVGDIEQTVEQIRSMLEADEWFDSENYSSSSGYLVIRVKTANLDAFLDILKADYTVTNYLKSATDISLQYQSTQNRIDSYNAERDRLLLLYENASLSDMITINSRIAAIDLALGELQGTLNSYDSLVDYSKVTLTLHPENIGSHLPFGTRIIDGFISGFNALLSFFDGLVIVIVTILPFAIVFVPGGFGIYKLYQRYERKKKEKNELDNSKSSN